MEKPIIDIYIDKYEIPFEKSFLAECVTSVDRNNPKELSRAAIKYVVELEEIFQNALRDENHPSRKRLESDLQWLSESLGKNLILFVGHTETCKNYIRDFLFDDVITNDLETVFIIIGCIGDKIAHEHNMDPKYRRKKIVFFGFHELVHVYNGEIFACKEPHNKMPVMKCDYPTKFENKDKLLNKNGKLNLESLKAPDLNNELVNCCKAKFQRFSSIFVEYLNKRGCSKFTKEVLLRKISSLTDPKKMDETTFTNADGIACKEDKNCEIANPFKAFEEIAARYDNIFEPIFQEFNKMLLDLRKNPSDVGIHRAFFERLASLKEEEKGVLNYFSDEQDYNNLGQKLVYSMEYNNITFDTCMIAVIYKQYDFLLYFLQTYKDAIDFNVIYKDKQDNLLSILLSNLQDYDDELSLYKPIKILIKKDPSLILLPDRRRHFPVFYTFTYQYKRLSILMLETLRKEVKKNPKAFKGLNEEDIKKLQTKPLLWMEEKNKADKSFLVLAEGKTTDISFWKIAARYGADPDMSGRTIIGDYKDPMEILLDESKYKYPRINEDVVKLLCYYGNVRFDISEKLEYYSSDEEMEKLKSFRESNVRFDKKRMNSYKGWGGAPMLTNPGYRDALEDYKDSLYVYEHHDELITENIRILKECEEILNLDEHTRQEKQKALNQEFDLEMDVMIQSTEDSLYEPIERLYSLHEDIDTWFIGKLIPKEEKKEYRKRATAILIGGKTSNPVKAVEGIKELFREIQSRYSEMAGGRRRLTRKRALRKRKYTHKHR